MKATVTAYWNRPNTGATNESGFSVLPVGSRYEDGRFFDIGYFGYIWSATADYYGAYSLYLSFNYSNIYITYKNKKIGASIRCLKD